MSITLQAVTASNWRTITALEVAPGQQAWVAPNVVSLLEALYGFDGELAFLQIVPLAICYDDTPVGLILYNTSPTFERFFIMRVMIDQFQQGKGYGRTALNQLLGLFRAYGQAKEVAISYNLGNHVAQKLYSSCGFIELGPDNEGGIVMWQLLNPQQQPWSSLWNESYAATGSSFPY